MTLCTLCQCHIREGLCASAQTPEVKVRNMAAVGATLYQLLPRQGYQAADMKMPSSDI